MAMPDATDPKAFTGRHMLLVMLGFFGTVIAVNVVMAVSASVTWTGLAVQNSYVASQEFQVKQDAAREQRALGWRASFTYTPGAARLIVRDGAGNPVELGAVSLSVSRPVGAGDDQRQDMSGAADGGYAAALDLGPGTWDAVITAGETEQGPFELRQRFRVVAE